MASSLPAISLDTWHKTGDTFGFKGHRVFYRKSGSGPAMIVLHGFPTCGWDWAWIEPFLAEHFTLFIPDLLDYGASHNSGGKPATIFDQAAMIEALMKHCDLGEADFLFHDVGDTIGQELLARRADQNLAFKMRSALFLNGGMLPSHHRPRPVQKLLAGPFGWLFVKLIRKEKMLLSLADVFGDQTRPDAALNDSLWRAILGVNGKAALARRIKYMRERRENAARWVGALSQSDIPMLLINGVDDPVSGAHAADEMARLHPHINITRLQGIGHFPQIEAPEAVADSILNFHERLSA